MRLVSLAFLLAPLVSSAQGFIENRGQWPETVLYLAQTPEHPVWIVRDGFVADLRETETPPRLTSAEAGRVSLRRQGHVVHVRVAEPDPGARAEGHHLLPGRRHVLVGERPVTGIRAFEEVHVVTEAGEAVRYSLSARGLRATVSRESVLHVEGARLGGVTDGMVQVDGRDRLLPLAEVVFEDRGSRREAEVRGNRLVAGGAWTPPAESAPRTGGDPMAWSTLLGDSGSDFADAVAVDGQGRVVIAGFTSSVEIPTTPGAYDETYNLRSDAYVARLTPDGSALDYATVIGGDNIDIAYGMATNAAGQVAVVGETISADFPGTHGAAPSDGSTAFVARLSADGSALDYAYLADGTGIERAISVLIDEAGAVVAGGMTSSADFPTTTEAFDSTFGGTEDAFVMGIEDGTLAFSTFLGGFNLESADALAFTTDDRIVVAGKTASSDFPTTPGAYDTTHGGFEDAFVAWLSRDGRDLLHSTFLGGDRPEVVWAVASDAAGRVVVGGRTISRDFPTTPGAVVTDYQDGSGDGFVSRLSSDGASLKYSTFLGGDDLDVVNGIAFDAEGRIVAAGATRSADFPAPAGTASGFDDAFVVRFDPGETALDGGTFIGAADVDEAHGLALLPDGRAVLAGSTRSTDFPTTDGAFDRTHGGSSDVFVTALSLPAPVAREARPVMGWEVSAPIPTPTQDAARMRLVLDAPAHVRVSVHDALGRRIGDLRDRTHGAGTHAVPLQVAQFAAGVYLVRVAVRHADGREGAVTRRLVVAR